MAIGSGIAMLSTIEWLDRLVGIDTTSRNSNLPLIEPVREVLVEQAIGVTLVFSRDGSKAALLASVGPKDAAGILLSGHSDVVPVDGQAWSGDPFTLRRQGDRLLGRGACDMKGFVAASLAALTRLRTRPLKRPFHLILSYDEEIGCKGVEPALDALERLLPHRPLGCVVGEPTGMRVVDGHKAKGAWLCEVTGLSGHSALTDRTANAVIAAAELIAEIGRMQRAFLAEGPFAAGFDPPCTTANVGRIEGGGQINVVPDRCRFELEFRTIPATTPEACLSRLRGFADAEVLPRLRQRSDQATIRFTPTIAYPGLAPSSPPDPFVTLCCNLTGTLQPGRVAYGTEAGHIAARGIPCVVCGPGDMSVAHLPDEHVTIDQLDACDRFLEQLGDWACT
jgi:acetylornithine deacetylase